MKLVRRPALLVPLGLAAALALAPAAGAQTAPPPPSSTTTTTTMPPGTTEQIIAASLELGQTSSRLDVVAAQVAALQTKLAAAQAALADVTARANAAQTQLDQLKAELQGRAAAVYEQQDQDGAILRVEHVVDIAVGEAYTNAASADENRQLDQLKAVEAQLQAEQAQRTADAQSVQTDEANLQSEQASLEAVRTRDENILSMLGGIPVMGGARVNAAQLAGWFHSTGAVAHLAGNTSIEDLANMYILEGDAYDVAGDLAFAQAVLETGSFGHALDSNFAGIGACDSCTSEIAFPTPLDGVRAQIQLLRSYADPGSRAEQLPDPPEPALFGSPPLAAIASYDSFSYKGSAPAWNVMGNGKWATDPDYSIKILEIYARMIAYASQHP
ncbi:MAG TPA: glucosaminidase domain-containing protein [Acidimicrobiia bacterium]|nr:glucosaminidase domain-containing protein [Acidimicrobiia bacterium]